MIIDYDRTYFSPKDVLECGQIFRFAPYKDGYKVYSKDKACYVRADGNKTVIECTDGDYFYNFFDLDRDYALINAKALSFDVPILKRGCELGKGLRLLNQDAEEMIYSFIISQNNNIPRIKGIIERICRSLGKKRDFMGEEYYTFPASAALASVTADFYKALGAGYRDSYLAETSQRIAREGISELYSLDSVTLKKRLLTYKGVGPKVADCISLFGFGRRECFPVDTWIEKLYREDFGGTLKDRNKINAYFCEKFGQEAGYIQQYLFYAKRENM
ncbi:MAG: 8-oxoguanine DNA glycosylase [Clostridia bacterium]|nr:8-oxoguanine DNA glycosylase [Clostridia bacterium]